MKVCFVEQNTRLPVPATMGGAMEQLLTILLEENEKSKEDIEMFFVQNNLEKIDKKFWAVKEYKKSKFCYIYYNKIVNKIRKIINKICDGLKIKKTFPLHIPNQYQISAFKMVKKINPDIIIFENSIDSNTKRYTKYFGKERIFYHMHFDDERKIDLSKFFGGTISVSKFINDNYHKKVKFENDTNDYILPNCVDEDLFTRECSLEEKKELKSKFGFDKDDFVVLYCGRINEKKGVLELIKAILHTEKRIKLLIVGGFFSTNNEKSKFLSKIENYVKQHSEKIKFTGYVDNAQLFKYYQIADLQVVPSLNEEAAGLVVIEGQHCGLPQIVTKSGGMVEYVPKEALQIERDDKLVENLEKEITRLSNDKQSLEKMRIASFENSIKYKKNDYYKNFVKIVKDIESKNK